MCQFANDDEEGYLCGDGSSDDGEGCEGAEWLWFEVVGELA